MKAWIYSALLLCLFAGCRNQTETAATRSSIFLGPKPIVTIVPVFDHAKHRLPWNVSQELTTGINLCLERQNRLYLVDQGKISKIVQNIEPDQNPFGEDIQWIRKTFRNEEFVAFIELFKHDEIPLNFQENVPLSQCPAELYMSARIRIFDLRGPTLKIVLSEVLNHSENIPTYFTRINHALLPPDHEDFHATPQGMAHDSFAQEIATRIEDYVLLSL